MAKQARARTRVTRTRAAATRRDNDDTDDRPLRQEFQEVWETSRDVWDGSCRLLGSLIIGIGEAFAPPNYSRRRVEREYDDGDEHVQSTTETTTRRQDSATTS